MKKCNIITTIVSHTNSGRIDSCLNTWIKNIKYPNDYVIAGDLAMSKKYDKTINASFNIIDSRKFLFFKTYNIIEYVIQNYDFNFWHKCDDDVYVNYVEFDKLVKTYNPEKDLYLGRFIPARLPKYAMGMSYVISKPLLQKIYKLLSYNILQYIDIAEDRSIGRCAEDCNIQGISEPAFFCYPPQHHDELMMAKICNMFFEKSIVLSTIHKESTKYLPIIHQYVNN